MDTKVNKLWTEFRSALLANPYSAPQAKSRRVIGGLLNSLQFDDMINRKQERLLCTIFSAGLWDTLYPQRNDPQLATIVYNTIEEKKSEQFTFLSSMFPCAQWLTDSEWIYNAVYKPALVALQSTVNYLAQNPVFQKTYEDSALDGRQYQRPIVDLDEAGDLSLSEYAFSPNMRLQRIFSGEALVTKQRAKTKRKVGRLVLLDTSHSMTTGVLPHTPYGTWSSDNIQRWVYGLAVLLDSLNNLQKYGGVLRVASFNSVVTDYGVITVDNAVQWLADEIKSHGTWISGSSAKTDKYVQETLSSMAVDDLELVIVTDGEIPVPSIDLGSTKCHVFGMATDNPNLQALTQQTGGVYMRLDKIQ